VRAHVVATLTAALGTRARRGAPQAATDRVSAAALATEESS
jgi:hypothetical protein